MRNLNIGRIFINNRHFVENSEKFSKPKIEVVLETFEFKMEKVDIVLKML